MTTSDEIKTGIVTRVPSGEIIATGVSEEEYMERYAGDFCEWVGGTVIKMSPVTDRHNQLTQFLIVLFSIYFDLRPIGKVRSGPFIMRIEAINSKREPDIQIILNTNA